MLEIQRPICGWSESELTTAREVFATRNLTPKENLWELLYNIKIEFFVRRIVTMIAALVHTFRNRLYAAPIIFWGQDGIARAYTRRP